MLLEMPKKCSLILVIDVALNCFAQNLHFNSKELSCFASGVTHSTNVHSIALKGAHGIVYFLETKEQMLGAKEELLRDIFTKQLTTKLYVKEN
jgi:hypothetical protein